MSKMYIDKMCATTNTYSRWEEIDFNKAEKCVKKLQKRIAVAYKNHRHDVLMNLQHKLVHSFYARALAVKCVTTNRGKDTPGVDNVIWSTSDEKLNAIHSLRRRGYNSQSLKRIYIPKGNGKMRPLSIPTMHDRAMQTLYKFALDPIAEISGDEHSYGFRTNRCVKDAIIHFENLLHSNPTLEWILKVDIKSCFDNISHEWLLDHIEMDKDILRKFLKTAYVENSITYTIDKGVPQGGAISSVICNMTLDGLESLLYRYYGNAVHMIRYADDILVLGNSPQLLVQDVQPIIQDFLAVRGLELAKEKTVLSHITQGVTFLGWKIYKVDRHIISTPKRKSIDSLLFKIETKLTRENCISYERKCWILKSILNGWLNFYIGVAPKQALFGVECEVILLLNSIGHKDVAGKAKILFAQKLYLYERW